MFSELDISSENTLIYVIDKETGVKAVLQKNKETGEKVYWDAADDKITEAEFLDLFPGLKPQLEKYVGDETFNNLRKYGKGTINARQLLNSNETIYKVVETRGKPYDDYVVFELEDDDFFFQDFLGFSEWEESTFYLLRDNNYEFIDWYRARDDFYEGYAFFSYLNKENEELLGKLGKILISNDFDLSNENNRADLAKKLHDEFPRNIDNILEEFIRLLDYDSNIKAEKAIKSEIDAELEKLKLSPWNNDYSKLEIKVVDAINLYLTSGLTNKPFSEVLLSFSDEMNLPSLEDGLYEYEEISEESIEKLNNEIEWELEKIYDTITEDIQDLPGYTNLVEELESKYKFNTWIPLPKDPKISFKIIKVNFDKKIVVGLRKTHSKPNTQGYLRLPEKEGVMTYDNFNLLLYHPELFNIFEN